MSRVLHWVAALMLVAACWGSPREASAHGFRPGVLTLEQLEPGMFVVRWVAPVDTSRAGRPVQVQFPDPCRLRDDLLDCGGLGLAGEVVFEGLEGQRAPVVVRATFVDGRSSEATVWPGDPRWSADRARPRSPSSWISTGVVHIFRGIDHLAFLLGLLMVVGFASLRRLLGTITAFTVAHSVALTLASQGWLHVRAAPVEATIAASVLLVARESVRAPRQGVDQAATFTARRPWVVALLFGLVHGLGFAGALDGETAGAVVASTVVLFNVGVELGQIAVIMLCYGLLRLLPDSVRGLRPVASYALGGISALWLIERIRTLLMAAS